MPPQASLDRILETWTVRVPAEDRPTEPEHDEAGENVFDIVLRASADGRSFTALVGSEVHPRASSPSTTP